MGQRTIKITITILILDKRDRKFYSNDYELNVVTFVQFFILAAILLPALTVRCLVKAKTTLIAWKRGITVFI